MSTFGVNKEVRCAICEKLAEGAVSDDLDWVRINCHRCGWYDIAASLNNSSIDDASEEDRIRLAGVTRQRSEYYLNTGVHEVLQVTRETLFSLLALAPQRQDVFTRGRMLLKAIAIKSQYPGEFVLLDQNNDYPLVFGSMAHSRSELLYVAKYLKQAGLANLRDDVGQISLNITAQGYDEISKAPRVDSRKAFVAMWFDKEVQYAYSEGIEPAITACGYRSVRIDLEPHNEDIMDRVIAEINESRFVVADLTGHRNGVYYEGGYARGLGIPVIWTCRNDHGDDSHFDVEHMNQIRWTTPEELQAKLAARIRATIGKGPLVPGGAAVGD